MTIDLDGLHKDIQSAYKCLSALVAHAQDAEAKYAEASSALASKRQAIIAANAADMKVLGSNEAAREATIAGMCAIEQASANVAENKRRLAKDGLELARIEVERVRALLRLAEIEASCSQGGAE